MDAQTSTPETTPETAPIDDEEAKRRRILGEAEDWARAVDSDNAWDRLVLTLGTVHKSLKFFMV